MSSIPRDSSAGAVAASARGAVAPAEVAWLVAGGATLLALLVFLFWEFFETQVRFAIRDQADWGHTLVIPAIAGYFVYLNRERLANIGLRTTWIGLLPVVLGTGWYMLCWLGPPAIRHHNLQGAGVAATLFGLTLLFAGWRAMAILWFPLAYLCVFGQTISDRFLDLVTFKLQDITAAGSWVMLNLIGIDTERAGNLLTVFHQGEPTSLNIAEACSGMRMLMAFLALGVAMAYTGFEHTWQRVALVLLGVPVAVAVNILRVVTLGFLSRFDTDFAAGDFHTFIGLVWLVPAFLIYLGLMWILRHLVTTDGAHAA